MANEKLITRNVSVFDIDRYRSFLFAFMCTTKKKTYSKLLGEETSGNHQAYRRGHLDITILNKIRAAKECGRN